MLLSFHSFKLGKKKKKEEKNKNWKHKAKKL